MAHRAEVLEMVYATTASQLPERVLCRDIAAINRFLEDFCSCLPASKAPDQRSAGEIQATQHPDVSGYTRMERPNLGKLHLARALSHADPDATKEISTLS